MTLRLINGGRLERLTPIIYVPGLGSAAAPEKTDLFSACVCLRKKGEFIFDFEPSNEVGIRRVLCAVCLHLHFIASAGNHKIRRPT